MFIDLLLINENKFNKQTATNFSRSQLRLGAKKFTKIV